MLTQQRLKTLLPKNSSALRPSKHTLFALGGEYASNQFKGQRLRQPQPPNVVERQLVQLVLCQTRRESSIDGCIVETRRGVCHPALQCIYEFCFDDSSDVVCRNLIGGGPNGGFGQGHRPLGSVALPSKSGQICSRAKGHARFTRRVPNSP